MIKYYYKKGRNCSFLDIITGERYLIAYNDESGFTWSVYKNKKTSARQNTFIAKCIKEGDYALVDEKTLIDFGIFGVKDGFYGDSQHKPFVISNFSWEDSVFVLERKDGNWETAMISGPDFSEPDAKKGSKAADEYDNNVLNRNFKQVEIQ